MKIFLKLFFSVCALLLLSTAAMSQSHDRRNNAAVSDRNPAVVIVGSAAKGTWVVTAFATKILVKPVAKQLILHVTPTVTKLVIKNAAKEALPLMVRLSVL